MLCGFQGAANCLEGITFVITGVLESFERDETKSLIEKYGGKVTGNISKKTSYVILGRDAGESKMAKVGQQSSTITALKQDSYFICLIHEVHILCTCS